MNAKLRGHHIEMQKGVFVYSDTKETTSNNWEKRACGNCGLHFTKEGHDGCLGALPNVMNACCGHGIEKEAYVQFMDGRCIRGVEALNKINKLTK